MQLDQRKGSSIASALVDMRGFSLIEVLVALVVISVGMLGIAKIQGLAYSSTSTSGLRSLAAIEAASMASAMRANRAYWATGAAPTLFSVTTTTTSSTITISDTTLAAATANCTSSACSPANLAAYDIKQWASALQPLLPNTQADFRCPTSPTPITCTIDLSWSEKTVAINKQGANDMAPQKYTLYVEP